MIRFSFSDVFTGELVNTSLYWRALYELADALWRVRVFRNPQKDGDGEFYSINMEVREPLWRSDGVPVCEWEHGGDGARVGDAPVPLRHKGTLLFGGTEGIFVHD